MDLLGRAPADWARELAAHGTCDNILRAVRAVYRGEVAEPWTLPSLGSKLVAELERLSLRAELPEVLQHTRSDDGAEKLLVATASGSVEAVLIPEVRLASSKEKMRRATAPANARPPRPKPPRAAGCISTQVGCAVGCRFCASGLLGLAKNLSAAEIVAQVLLLRRAAREKGILLTTLVFMGMGEPLHNTENVLSALERLTDRHGAEFGCGTITVSTVGVVAGIEQLAALGRRAPNLALSLHAPDDATRERIIPMKNLATAREALAAAKDFARSTGRFVTVSYVLLDGVNDHAEQAEALGELLHDSGFHVNLIPVNAVEGLDFAPSPKERAQAFWTRLRERGVSVHFRKPRGAESDAACGQLRRRSLAADATS